MNTLAQDVPTMQPGRARLGWVVMGLACVGIVALVLRDARTGSLEVGRLQGLVIFGMYVVAAAGRGLAENRLGEAAQDVARTGVVGLQLMLVAATLTALQIESPAFYGLLIPLAFTGFLIHHVLPAAIRPAFFVALSVAAIGFVFGPVDAAWLVGLGIVLIALCHVPVGWGIRVAAVLAVGTGYAVLRTGAAETPWSAAIWPILGSMFMFRLIVYLHHLKHAKARPGLWSTLSYFFLLPNVMFPLFPVIDFKTFERTYYNRDAHAIYQRGVRWLMLGIVHLIAYRLVYHHVILPTTEVRTTVDLGRQMAGNFMLYLRVSGQFHLIIGLLHLFGFGLPETNRFFFLTSSFNDFWRRINIYWKEFMMKTFYYPSVFVTKKRGMVFAIIAGTTLVFVLNWVLHAYQWFWVVGATPISATDTMFWLLLGVAMVVNGVWELKKGRERTLGDSKRMSARAAMLKALKIVAFFCTISILWSMWTTPTFEQWFVLLDVDFALQDLLVLGLALGIAFAGLTLLYMRSSRSVEGAAAPIDAFSFRGAGLGVVGAAVLLLLASPATFSGASPEMQRFAQSLRVEELNRADSELLTRGYYERLTGVNQFNGQLWSAYAAEDEEPWDEFSAGMVPLVDDHRRRVLAPLFGELTPQGWVTTNADGMHDRDYAATPPPNTFRVAMIGPSYLAAVRIGTGNAFEALAEAQLATESRREGASRRDIEVLNFGIPGYTMPQQLFLLRDKVAAYDPDVVILAANPQDVTQNFSYLAWMGQTHREVPPPHGEFLHRIVAQAGVDSTFSRDAALSAVEPYRWEVLEWAYEEIVDTIREMGATPVWMHTPLAMVHDPGDVDAIRSRAEAAGFAVYDLTHIIASQDLTEVRISAVDRHLNAFGNELLVEPFAEILRELERTN